MDGRSRVEIAAGDFGLMILIIVIHHKMCLHFVTQTSEVLLEECFFLVTQCLAAAVLGSPIIVLFFPFCKYLSGLSVFKLANTD